MIKNRGLFAYLVVVIIYARVLYAFSDTNIVNIPSGKLTPLFGLDENQKYFEVNPFRIDIKPVTNLEFSKFLIKNPQWQKANISKLYKDEKYLEEWSGSQFKNKNKNAPVTNISWFAASAYCESVKGRLPTTLEWEYVAAASKSKSDASRDSEFVDKILGWYQKNNKNISQSTVGKSEKNYYGVQDLHELVWEWTSDFNSFFVANDNRSDGEKIKNMFCGGSSIGAKNREDYAAFMRYAFRSSLNANYSTSNLGFRCAYDFQ